MNTKTIPAIIMLSAGFIACLTGINAHMEVAAFMKMLLVVLIIFYILGCIIKAIIDKNFIEIKEETTDGNETETDEEMQSENEETAQAEDEE